MAANKSIYLALGIHNHQPVGNPSSIFEQTFKSAYEPFLKLLAKHPKVKVSMHYSGLLLQWLVEKHPEYANKLKDLNNKGQIELLTGGFYEPIISAIPDRDKIGQIGKLTKYIEEKFSFTPKGLWLTERIWEPHLPKALAEAGVEYTILDESHFQKKDVLGYYVTEEQGYTTAVFPINFDLRRAIPYKPVNEVLELIKESATEEGNGLICFADDGEKFGAWPDTYKSVYDKGWLEKFFEKIASTPWIKITSFSEYRKKFPPLGRLYIPACSYPEMNEWADGMWRNFLVKYPEANNLHKKQLYVSQKVEKVKELEIKTRAQEDLWRGQTNDAYWHGLFGGLYLPHLRNSVYMYLIKSESLVDRYLHRGGPWLDVEISDIDKDLRDEVLINSDKLNLYLRPTQGGQLVELDYKPRACNYQALMSRRPEPYHTKKDLVDWYPRYSFIDHFLSPETTLDTFSKSKYNEQGDFVNSVYHFDIERNHEHATVKLVRDGHVTVKNETHAVRVEKRIIVPRGEAHCTVELHLTNGTSHNLPLWFGSEISFNFLSTLDPASGIYFEDRTARFSETLAMKGVNNLILKDGLRKVEITMTLSKTAELWTFPLETVSRSEKGLERLFQGTILLPHWQLTLGPKGTWKSVIAFHFKDLV